MFMDNIRTVGVDGGLGHMDAELRALLTTAIGTLPGSRAFGIEDYVDENTYDVENELAAAVDEGCERYIPEITVAGVTCRTGADGRMEAAVYVEGRDEY